MTKDELSILQKLLKYTTDDIEKYGSTSYQKGRKDTLEQIIELFGGAK